MKRILLVLTVLLLGLNCYSAIIFPNGGNDNDILVKNGDSDPKNDYHYKFLETEPDSLIGSDEKGLTKQYKINTFAPIVHEHTTDEIIGLDSIKVKNAETADSAAYADETGYADKAESALKSEHADKADLAERAIKADNGLNVNAPVGTSPIKTATGYTYEKAGLPAGGKAGQVLFKLSNNDFDFTYGTVDPMPALKLKDSIYYINKDMRPEFFPRQKFQDALNDQVKTMMVFVWITYGGEALCIIFIILGFVYSSKVKKRCREKAYAYEKEIGRLKNQLKKEA